MGVKRSALSENHVGTAAPGCPVVFAIYPPLLCHPERSRGTLRPAVLKILSSPLRHPIPANPLIQRTK